MYDAALGRFLGVELDPEHAESMGTSQDAFANPVIFNDPLGDKASEAETLAFWAKALS